MKKDRPTEPKTREQINFQGDYLLTHNLKKFLLFETKDTDHCMAFSEPWYLN